MSTRRLQVKTIALGRAAYNVAAIIVNILTPYMINPTAWVSHFFFVFTDLLNRRESFAG